MTAPVPPSPPSVWALLEEAAARHGARVALRHVTAQGEPDGETSFEALREGAARVGRALTALGIARGDRVALSLTSGRAFVEAWFGALHAGATLVPIPTSSSPREVACRAEHARVVAVLHDTATAPIAEPLLTARPSAAAVHVRAGGQVEGRALAASSPSVIGPSGHPPAMILYTSGTTGSAKGAAISHRSLVAHTRGLVEHVLRLTPADRILGVLPLTHSYGCRMVMLAGLAAGASVVLAPRFSARGALNAARWAQVTWIPAVPTMFAAWAAVQPTPEPLTSVAWALSAGAPLPDAVRRRAEAVLGASVRQGYGMTEATFSTVDAPPDPPRPGTVGRPAHGVRVRVVGPDGRDRDAGLPGEVWLRGPNVMDGYVDAPDATAKVLVDGWMRSGDLGVLDVDGRLTVVDRLKDLIVRGGFNVVPAEVEAALISHPEVSQAAVVGLEDPFYGQRVAACLVARGPGARPTLEALRAHAAEHVDRQGLPEAVAWMDALPLGPSRKVLKRELRRMWREGELSTETLPGRGEATSDDTSRGDA